MISNKLVASTPGWLPGGRAWRQTLWHQTEMEVTVTSGCEKISALYVSLGQIVQTHAAEWQSAFLLVLWR